MEKITRDELLRSPEFWEENFKMELFNAVKDHLIEHSMTKKELAAMSGCDINYISRILEGKGDHQLSEVIRLLTSIGKAPYLHLRGLNEVIEADEKGESVYLDR